MQVSGLTATDLHNFLGAAAFQVLLTCDDAGRMPFHYLKYRRRSIYEGGSESEARTDDAIAELVVGVAKAEPKVTQLLLQQSAAHGFSVASLRLIQECSAKVDEASDYDPRMPREIGKDAHDAKTRAIFDDRDDVYRRELALKRRATFLETMVTREPWNLQAEVFQEWLLSRASKSQKKLLTLVDRMGDIAGVTVLEKWVEIGGLHKGKPNFGKVSVKQNNTPHIDLTCAMCASSRRSQEKESRRPSRDSKTSLQRSSSLASWSWRIFHTTTRFCCHANVGPLSPTSTGSRK